LWVSGTKRGARLCAPCRHRRFSMLTAGTALCRLAPRPAAAAQVCACAAGAREGTARGDARPAGRCTARVHDQQRRLLLLLPPGLLLLQAQPPPARAEGGLARYIKKRKLEPLEAYVPAVVAAREQLAACQSQLGAALTHLSERCRLAGQCSRRACQPQLPHASGSRPARLGVTNHQQWRSLPHPLSWLAGCLQWCALVATLQRCTCSLRCS